MLRWAYRIYSPSLRKQRPDHVVCEPVAWGLAGSRWRVRFHRCRCVRPKKIPSSALDGISVLPRANVWPTKEIISVFVLPFCWEMVSYPIRRRRARTITGFPKSFINHFNKSLLNVWRRLVKRLR